MRIAFVGGTRFIGAAAVSSALARGHRVAVIHRGVHENTTEGVKDLLVDADRPHLLRAALNAWAPDALVDTRAMTRQHAEHCTSAFNEELERVVVLSSTDIYARFAALREDDPPKPARSAITEDDPLTGPTPYPSHPDWGRDYDKKHVEQTFRCTCEEREVRCVVLRLPATYGHGDYRRRFGPVLDALDAGEDELPRAGGAFRWTHGHVRDVAHAIVLAAERAPEGVSTYNVGERRAPTMSEWAERIARARERTFRWREVEHGNLPERFHAWGQLPHDIVLDTSRIRRELGYDEVTEERERVDDLIRWLETSRPDR